MLQMLLRKSVPKTLSFSPFVPLAQPVKPPQPSGNERDETLCLDIFFSHSITIWSADIKKLFFFKKKDTSSETGFLM
jgi:hypothetical protein